VEDVASISGSVEVNGTGPGRGRLIVVGGAVFCGGFWTVLLGLDVVGSVC
jgi:hypothetical protein